MARVRRINVSQIEGDTASGTNIQSNGEMALYQNGNNFDLVIHDGMTGISENRVLGKGIFYGYGKDSADGFGLNTIKLIPDVGIFQNSSHQYLIVDPTSPNHIHLRAGGAIDNSTAELIIGGEKNFVKVSDSYDNVVVSVDDQNIGTKEWTFSSNGVITLPASGDLVDSTSVSQLANRASGTWTVTAGTNTYSFEVPQNGTYSMWVRGNIPNGIIVWNATVTVTNSNVPVVGTQYAWNYTGAGSPILLTAIPDQITGTAGTISTDNSYAGTTSNVFAFSIANTSGSDQTVYWGYTKV